MRFIVRCLLFAVACSVSVLVVNNMFECRIDMPMTSPVDGESGAASASAAGVDWNDLAWPESEVPLSEFAKDQPKMVVVLSYLKAGGSFIGQMFNTNPNAFYADQPLDALYSALYGTRPGSNIPSDIFAYWNGTFRQPPIKEQQSVSKFIGYLLTCDLGLWPTEIFVHPYLTQFSHVGLDQYIRCLAARVNLTEKSCHQFTTPFCGQSFGERSPSRLDECNRLLWSDQYLAEHRLQPIRLNFTAHQECTISTRHEANDHCAPKLASACRTRQLRAINVVRATMDSLEPLLKVLPNMRVIHVVRDPRPVVASRFKTSDGGGPRSRAKYTDTLTDRTEALVFEASVYCRQVARDVRSSRRLAVAFPGRVYRVAFDDAVRRLGLIASNVHRFIDEPIERRTSDWIGAVVRNGTSLIDANVRWQDALSVAQSRRILSACADALRLMRLPLYDDGDGGGDGRTILPTKTQRTTTAKTAAQL